MRIRRTKERFKTPDKDHRARSQRTRLAMQQGMLWSSKPQSRSVWARIAGMLYGVLAALAHAVLSLIRLLLHALSRKKAPASARHPQPQHRSEPRTPARGEAVAKAPAQDGTRIIRIAGYASLGILTAFAVVFGVYLVRAAARPHTAIVSNQMVAEIIAPYAHPEELVAYYGIPMGVYDRLLVDEYEEGRILRVDRMLPTFIVTDDGTRDVWMNSGTVGDALNKASILVREDDLVVPPVDEPLMPGQGIEVIRIERETIEEYLTIDFKTTRIKDDTIEIGKKEVKQKGIDGKRLIVTELVYRNGELYSTDIVKDEIIQEQQTYIVHEGTKPKATPKPSVKATPTPVKRVTKAESVSAPDANGIVTITVGGKRYKARPMTVEVTAYTHTGNRTATGTKTKVGTIAVDRDVISLGTKMFVPGYGMGTAEDVGVHGEQIDILLDTAKEAIRWGRKRNYTIYILQ